VNEASLQVEEDEDDRFLRTEFLERVAHELRGPAGVTLGALDELELALAENPTPRLLALLSMARRGARRVLRTAERLSRTAQLEAGSVSVTPFPIDIRNIVTRATLEAADTEGRSSVEVVTDVPDEACMVAADSGWIGIAIAEMVGQAIRCAARLVRVHVSREGDVFVVSVTDDRSAKPEVARARFSRNGGRRDTGLDMPLIQDVARMHGAPVEVLDHREAHEDGRRGGVSQKLRLPATR
jgi:signal transduction histidine kinase